MQGHSLGGAVAVICAVWASLQWPAADVYVATFGEPMPGNRQFGQVRFSPGDSACQSGCLRHLDWSHDCLVIKARGAPAA